MKSAREGNCFRLVLDGFVPSSRTITRTIWAVYLAAVTNSQMMKISTMMAKVMYPATPYLSRNRNARTAIALKRFGTRTIPGRYLYYSRCILRRFPPLGFLASSKSSSRSSCPRPFSPDLAGPRILCGMFPLIAYPMCRCNYLRFLELRGVSVSLSESPMHPEQQMQPPVSARNRACGRISRIKGQQARWEASWRRQEAESREAAAQGLLARGDRRGNGGS